MTSVAFSLVISLLVFGFARPLMSLFIDAGETAVISEGVRYLRIEGAFYALIGILFLLYGLYRALGKPGMSVILTVMSLGTRVALAYALSALPIFGVVGIWWSVPIGWFLADALGIGYYFTNSQLAPKGRIRFQYHAPERPYSFTSPHFASILLGSSNHTTCSIPFWR